MTYSPGNPGFQPSQPPGSYGPSTPSFAKSGGEVESKLPQYLRIAVVALGLGVYLANFGPIVTITDVDYPLILSDAGHTVPLAVLAALLAGAALLPKAKSYTAVVAVVSALGALLAISTVADASGSYTIGWGLWLILIFSVLQAAAAVGSLLLEAGVVTAPAPRPKYDPYAQYGLPPGGNYYGQPGQQGYGHQGHQAPQQSGYPSSYGSYPECSADEKPCDVRFVGRLQLRRPAGGTAGAADPADRIPLLQPAVVRWFGECVDRWPQRSRFGSELDGWPAVAGRLGLVGAGAALTRARAPS